MYMYIARYAKQSFFCILEKFDCFATLHKTLSVWAKGLRPFAALTATRHSGGTLYGIHGYFLKIITYVLEVSRTSIMVSCCKSSKRY